MDKDVKTNRIILIITLVFLMILSGLLLKFYVDQKNENSALRIKLISMSANKRTPTTWKQMTTNAPIKQVQAPRIPIADMPLEALVSELNSSMKNVRSLDAVTLDRNVQLADEIITREPASYSAYKAKLISLLVKEGKHKTEIEDSDVDSLLETMAGFDITTDSVARKEAALLSNATAQLEQFESTVQTSLEDDNYLNEDVVEIPFMRLMAKNEFDSVIDNAESFIEQFPSAVSGYFYLIKGMEYLGRNEEALAVIRNSQLPPEAQQALQSRLDQAKGSNPKNYWERLSF